MSIQILLIILSIAQGLFMILLAVLAFWLKRFITSVDNLGLIVTTMQIKDSAKEATCGEKHISINARLKNVDTELTKALDIVGNLITRVTVLERREK